jgi:hypothetical protein
MLESTLPELPGGRALLDWFGRVPRFHDAELLEVAFSGGGSGLLRIHAWNITGEVDAQGYYVLDRHAVVVLALEGVSVIDCTDYDMMPSIISDLEITSSDQQLRIRWSASYGVEGSITAKQVRITLEPGKP